MQCTVNGRMILPRIHTLLSLDAQYQIEPGSNYSTKKSPPTTDTPPRES